MGWVLACRQSNLIDSFVIDDKKDLFFNYYVACVISLAEVAKARDSERCHRLGCKYCPRQDRPREKSPESLKKICFLAESSLRVIARMRSDEAIHAQRTACGLLRPLASQRRRAGRQPIRQSVKHEVVRNDGMQCAWRDANGVRCQQRRWVNFHHLKEVQQGGLNIAPNLKLLCYPHHRLVHEAKAQKEQVCRDPNLVNTAVPLPRQREVPPR